MLRAFLLIPNSLELSAILVEFIRQVKHNSESIALSLFIDDYFSESEVVESTS